MKFIDEESVCRWALFPLIWKFIMTLVRFYRQRTVLFALSCEHITEQVTYVLCATVSHWCGRDESRAGLNVLVSGTGYSTWKTTSVITETLQIQ